MAERYTTIFPEPQFSRSRKPWLRNTLAVCVAALLLADSFVGAQQDLLLPVGSVVAAVTLSFNSTLVALGTEARLEFEQNFKDDVAAALGIDPSFVTVSSVEPGGTVNFGVIPGDDGTPRDPTALRAVFNSPIQMPNLARQELGISAEATTLVLEDLVVITLAGAEEPETSPTVYDDDDNDDDDDDAAPDRVSSTGGVRAATRWVNPRLSVVAVLAVLSNWIQ